MDNEAAPGRLAVYTQRASLARIAERWKEQYFVGGSWLRTFDPRGSQSVYDALVAKGSDLTAEDADAIVGNTTWTQQMCDACMVYTPLALIICGSDDNPTYLCCGCVATGLAMLERAQ